MLQPHIYLALFGFSLAMLLNLLAERQLDHPFAWREQELPLPSRLYAGGFVLTFLLPFVYVVIGSGWELVIVYTLLIVLYLTTQTDLAEMIIPDKFVFAGLAVASGLRLTDHPLPLWNYLAAAFAGSGFLLVVGVVASRLLRQEAMGGGDIKLYVLIGVVLGLKLTLLSIFVASVVGLIVALIHKLIGSGGKIDRPMPFGPSIAVSALVCCLWGDRLLSWYWSSMHA
ncbi:prepilin peptidase [Paenibacillus kobensis]|uniref:prepilin peptidase n=1 Tax=Paenibacillus kobensis TaxID=59841 RepID=UPI000FDB1B2B|nr:A24 family peptidase [Paenibacillus kobensis]